jgi:malate dehydrogenase
MKVTVVGAGAVGATCADNIHVQLLCERHFLDKRGLARQSQGYDADCVFAGLIHALQVQPAIIPKLLVLMLQYYFRHTTKPGINVKNISTNAGIVRASLKIFSNILRMLSSLLFQSIDSLTHLALRITGLPKPPDRHGRILDSAFIPVEFTPGLQSSDLNATVIEVTATRR